MLTACALGAGLAACSTPEAPYPVLSELPVPKASQLPQPAWKQLQVDIQRSGDINREAGRMVRAAEELSRPLPK